MKQRFQVADGLMLAAIIWLVGSLLTDVWPFNQSSSHDRQMVATKRRYNAFNNAILNAANNPTTVTIVESWIPSKEKYRIICTTYTDVNRDGKVVPMNAVLTEASKVLIGDDAREYWMRHCTGEKIPLQR